MLKSPCQGCFNRTYPKYCESSCEKWLKYRAKKEEEIETIKENRKTGGKYVDKLHKGIK